MGSTACFGRDYSNASKAGAQSRARSLTPTSSRKELSGMTEDVKVLAWTIASKLLNENRFATINVSGAVYVYRDGVYTENGEAYTKRLVQQNVEPSAISTHLVNEVIGHVQRSTFVKPDIFLSDTQHLVVQNGLLDTSTGKVEAHTPNFYSLTKLPVAYDPAAGCPAFRKFLSEVVYAEDIPVIQEWFGYCLHRGYPAQVALLLIGEGSNGKSTLIGVLKALLGFESISSVSLQELEINRFAKADLFGKLANLYADLPDAALRGVGTFKMLTGGDPIRGEKKFQNSFPFVNFAKLIFSCNVVPEVYEDTKAFFRRWVIIQFPNSFEGEKADKDLLGKLTTAAELSGILNIALEGLARVKAKNWASSNSRSTEEVRLDYIRRSSPIKAFLMDCTAFKADGATPKKALFEAYIKYCARMKLATVTYQTFLTNLPIYVGEKSLTDSKETFAGRRVPCFRGIVLRPEDDWGKEGGEDERDEGEAKGLDRY